jgi:hypothetical protein
MGKARYCEEVLGIPWERMLQISPEMSYFSTCLRTKMLLEDTLAYIRNKEQEDKSVDDEESFSEEEEDSFEKRERSWEDEEEFVVRKKLKLKNEG